MEAESLQKELCLLLTQYMHIKYPDIYEEFKKYVETNQLLPPGCDSVEEAVSLRYKNFSTDHFIRFISTLRTDDDFPSIFRRITTFQTNKILHNLEIVGSKHVFCHKDSIYCMCTDPLSRILVTGSDDFSLKVFKLPEMQLVNTLLGHEGVITNIAINALCTMLVSSSHDKTIRIWSLSTGSCISVLSGFTFDVVHSVVFSPSGSMIVGACEDGTVPIWTTKDAIQGKPPCRVLRSVFKKSVSWVAFSPGGEFLAFSSEPASVTVVPMKTMIFSNLVFHGNLVDYLQFTKGFFGAGEYGPRLLTVSSDDGTVACWQMESGTWKIKYSIKHGGGRGKSRILKTEVDCEEKYLIISRSSNVSVYNFLTGEAIGQFPDTPILEDVRCIAAHPTKPEVFFVGNSSGDVALINVSTLKVMSSVNHLTSSLNEACWDTEGTTVYVSDDEGCVTVFNVFDGIGGKPSEEDFVDDYQFESIEFETKYQEPCMVDKNGVALKEQPMRIDIRELDLPLRALQAGFLNDTANELVLVQQMLSGEHPQQNTEDNHLDIAPPQHIQVSVETIQNPHGVNTKIIEKNKSIHDLTLLANDEYSDDLSETAKTAVKKHQMTDFEVVSDSDDWDLDIKEDDIDETEFQRMVVSSDVPDGVSWKPYLAAVVCDELSYIPQIGDEVFFIRDVYIPIAKRYGFDTSELLPEGDDIFATPIRCNVVYLAAHEQGAIVRIAYDKHEYELLFPVPENERFLILLPQYRASILKVFPLKNGDKIACSCKNGESIVTRKGIFITLTSSFSTNPYNSIKIKWEDNNEEVLISPWDITFIGRQKVYNGETFIDPNEEHSVLSVIDSVMAQEEYAPFISLRNYTTEQLNAVPIPMSLNLFRERVENVFYRSQQAMSVDLELLYSFAIIIFGEDSKEVRTSSRLIDQILKNASKVIKAFHKKK